MSQNSWSGVLGKTVEAMRNIAEPKKAGLAPAGPKADLTSDPLPKREERTGLGRIFLGQYKPNPAYDKAVAARNEAKRPTPNTEQLKASLGSGARGGSNSAQIPQQLEKAKEVDKAEEAKASQDYIAKVQRHNDEAWSRVAKTRELTADEWMSLTPGEQRAVTLNDSLLSAIGENATAGNRTATDTLRAQLGVDDKTVTSEEFASGMTGIRESDLFGEKNILRPDAATASKINEVKNYTGLGGLTRDVTDVHAWDNTSARQSMIEAISHGLDAYFSAPGAGAPQADSSTLDGILGRSSVTTGASETDQYLKEIFDATATKSVWDSGASYTDLQEMLAEAKIPQSLFDQYAGERVAEAEKTGIPLLEGDDVLDVAAYRAQLGLTEK